MAQTQTDALRRAADDPADRTVSASEPTALPRVLRVETGMNDARGMTSDIFVTLLDYHIYESAPKFWRALERALRFDLYLAWQAHKLAAQYDVVWAGSEKVAIPLTLLGSGKPLVVALHYPQAAGRARLLKWLNIRRRWQAIGYVSPNDREFLISELHYPPDRLMPVMSTKLRQFVPIENPSGDYVMSLGVTKRDYRTLLGALETLPDYKTEIFASSRYGDLFRGHAPASIPAWVHFRDRVSDPELIARYQNCRFVVVALEPSQQGSAGVSTMLEAAACGKAVIATRTTGTPSYMLDGETGILVPPEDVAALRAAIEKLWTEPERAKEMGTKGRRFVEERFDPRAISEGIRAMLLQVYQENKST